MAREYDDHLFNPQPTKNISKVTLPLPRMIEYDLKVVKLTHSWPEHLDLFISPFNCHAELVKGYFITHSWPGHLRIHLTHYHLRIISLFY